MVPGTFFGGTFFGRRRVAVCVLVIISGGLGLLARKWITKLSVIHTDALLTQDAYIWQREWSESVVSAVETKGRQFHRLLPLVGEISWQPQAHLVAVHPNYRALAEQTHTIGLVLRVGVLPKSDTESFRPDSDATELICRSISDAIAEAKIAGLDVAEVQIDFDCAESKLNGYASWVRASQRRVDPIPIVITALPSWLRHSEFLQLAKTAGSYILQVHSLHRPSDANPPMARNWDQTISVTAAHSATRGANGMCRAGRMTSSRCQERMNSRGLTTIYPPMSADFITGT